ncbi:MAG: hypothetical protein COU09_00405 [Candidatus Harrisonbacteria bacterium CG10_big_fil_rev_8_21_14_0_10_44_23]|uniref:Thymidylate synthase n=1 Tax=Candidatus Harrisonbacteria bacterium CG10_big_fil_rev_8_21_14_0_10_44_23 TaxID=1974585 RepID=A0A2H0UQW2_9BACT|nr:MAG: hypothetical protein COU09_00405 [Candidatus Harrisonbacteria bacterium CG10_big_fil_rev_8_21_14_0_10_44_23]
MAIKDLKHVHKKTRLGADVFVLNNGAEINAEAEAMLQALHSRSTGGFLEHLKKLEERGAEKFMASFYVGYGHKSIGDCGSTTIFIEGVSMLVAKAIQDWQLYSGQESSTRYVDFSKQAFINLADSKEGEEIQETWRAFYLKAQDPVRESLKKRFPIQEGEKEAMWEKAINARAFDITRSFLPAGASTNLAWHTNLRQAADHIMILRHSPLLEVRELAQAMEEVLREAFESSFSHERFETTENYNEAWQKTENYYHNSKTPDFALEKNEIDGGDLEKYREILEKRPEKTELPRFLDELGHLQFSFTLDFGSFRDIQRHRAVMQRMPLLTEEIGFHPWYLAELPDDLRKEAVELIEAQLKKINDLGLSKEEKQYYLPMGYLTSCRVSGGLPQIVYLVELRATRFVHPTLRERAQQMAKVLEEKFGSSGLKLHLDEDAHRFDVRRGEHDIVEKGSE